ncbi:SRPBCC family protein [Algibacter sp. PT7-4]|uniref:SRPBCC family protein n=1 Tax=Algibacter ulvanivorans TaxID=3400999 RepID=UPI003AAA6694
MPLIEVETHINADIQICFDLARDVGFYQKSLEHSEEIAIGGKTSGLVNLNDHVVWETNHLGFVQHLNLKITEFKAPNLFVDELVSGGFKAYKHEHIFHMSNNKTVMTDRFYYKLPFGLLGRFLNCLYVKKYMTKLLKNRNKILKDKAEKMQRVAFKK